MLPEGELQTATSGVSGACENMASAALCFAVCPLRVCGLSKEKCRRAKGAAFSQQLRVEIEKIRG